MVIRLCRIGQRSPCSAAGTLVKVVSPARLGMAPGGHLALTSFAAGEAGTGSELADADLYRERALHGGLAYTPESLRWIFSDLVEVELRRMREEPPESALFGVTFLWTALFRRGAAASGDARPVHDLA